MGATVFGGVCQCAVRLAQERMRTEGVSQWSAAVGVAEVLGCLLVRSGAGFVGAAWENTDRPTVVRRGDLQTKNVRLVRENRELGRTNEIVKAALAVFAAQPGVAACDDPFQLLSTRDRFGSGSCARP